MSTQEHYYKANAHDLRFWSRVQDELIQFCHDWCTGSEKCELYDIAIDLDRIVEMAPKDSRLRSPHQVASQLVYQLFI
jgi:hypothetical protein